MNNKTNHFTLPKFTINFMQELHKQTTRKLIFL